MQCDHDVCSVFQWDAAGGGSLKMLSNNEEPMPVTGMKTANENDLGAFSTRRLLVTILRHVYMLLVTTTSHKLAYW